MGLGHMLLGRRMPARLRGAGVTGDPAALVEALDDAGRQSDSISTPQS
jgi:hypothetical protein